MQQRELETTFWNIVEEGENDVEVHYGADLDTHKVGSGFPRAGCPNPWNLNNLPRLGGENGSMLRHMTDDVPGVNYPWMYMGMTFSSFCWHIEDHMFYSGWSPSLLCS